MRRKKNLFQRGALISAKISFLLSALSGVFLYLKVNELGYENPVSASLLGALFFFLFMGVLLTIVGNSDIPSFKVDPSE